jgi:peptidoglycan/LPS O-acetylase OafA/YrhL
MNSEKIYFKNLDSIRFIAATMVYFQHGLRPAIKFLEIKNIYVEKLLNTISNGELGVQIFFVLSGFLITYLLITEHEMNKKINLKYFYIRRVLMIWPLYCLVVAYSFFLLPFLETSIGNTPRVGANLLWHLTFLSNFDIMNVEKYFHGSSTLSQGITWSVSIEEQFYLFWPLIFFVFPKRLWIHSILVIIGASILFRILNNDDSFVLYYHTFSVIGDLGIGAVFAYLIKEYNKVKTFFEKSSTWTHLLFMIFSFFICFFSDSLFKFQYGNSIGRVFISFSFALIISAQALTKSESKFNLCNFSFANKWGKYT